MPINIRIAYSYLSLLDVAVVRREQQLHFIPGVSAHRVCYLPEGIVFSPVDSSFSCLHRMAQNVSKAAAGLVNICEGLDPAINAELAASFADYLPSAPATFSYRPSSPRGTRTTVSPGWIAPRRPPWPT